MKNKRFLILTIVIIILASMVVSCMACSNNEVKTMTKKFVSASSFTVESDGVEILRYKENKMYWKNVYGNMYDEYYFMPDGEGKYWVYKRGYSED